MPNFDSGVSYYTTGKASITVFFPEGQIKCQYCPYLKYEEWAKRYSCRITQERLLRPFEGIGHDCLLEIEGDVNE